MGLFSFLKKSSTNSTDTIEQKRSSTDPSPSQYQKMREDEENWLEKHFDFNSIEGIEKIPLRKNLRCPKTDGITGMVYYYLRRKSHQHEEDGNTDLALACLQKSNALQQIDGQYELSASYDLVKLLARIGKIEEAIAEKDRIDRETQLREQQIKKEFETKIKGNTQNLNTDLVIMDAHGSVCSECAKYQGRVYSVSGKSKKFPKAPDFYYTTGAVHTGCSHSFLPYIDGVNDPDLSYTLSVHPLKNKRYGKDIVTFSNRPFVDDRTDECRQVAEETHKKKAKELERQKHYEDHMIEIEARKGQEMRDFKWIQDNIPDKCPKSISGYRRMKSQNTKNYQVLKQLASDLGRDI